ncbi:MAG: pitrilysin family protein [Verrucomicrobiota bacterium]|nr:pitrilysin family protein [Verrucomicrobiota bacterium]
MIHIANIEKISDAHKLIERLFKGQTERSVLKNGLTLVQRSDFSSDVISVQVWVKTGSIHEGDMNGCGLSHFLEHLLFKGTPTREGKSISRLVHAMGGYINAYTTFDRTVYFIDAPANALEEAVELLADIILNSNFPQVEVDRERDVILREIDMGMDDPDQQLSQALFRTAFRKHSYREPVIGHRELFESICRDELLTYYHARYVPNNMVVSIVGAAEKYRIKEVVDSHFSHASIGRLKPLFIEDEPPQLALRQEIIRGDYNVVRGGIAFKVPGLKDPQSTKLDILASALGGGESSILWGRIRNELNLVHYIDCRNWNPGTCGLFWISYVCEIGKGQEVETAIWNSINSIIKNGISESVVEKARRQSLTAEINGRKTMSGQASRLGLEEVVVGDLSYTQNYLQQLQTISSDAVRKTAERFLVRKGASAVRLEPKEIDSFDDTLGTQLIKTCSFSQINLQGDIPLLYQVDNRLPVVHICCVLRGGPLYERDNQRGVSSLLAELLIKDTEKRDAASVAEIIDSIGGKMSASCGNNIIYLSIEVLRKDIDIAIEILSDALICPAFKASTFETEKNSQVAGLMEADDEILEFGFRKMRELFFGTHPFSIGPQGRIQDLQELEVQSVKSHYTQLVNRGNITLAACGDFDPKLLENHLNISLASELPDSKNTEGCQICFSGPETTDLLESLDREQAVILQGFSDVGILHEDFIIGEMLNELLSGMSSQLFEKIRDEKGLAYYVGSTRILGLQTSMFVIYAGTHPDQSQAVIEEIDAELNRIRLGDVSDLELERCRTRLKAARVMGRQTIGARAMHAATNLSYGLPVDNDADYIAKLDACDAKSLMKFVAEYFNLKKRVQLVIGPNPKK